MSDTQTQKAKKPIVIPKPNSDFYQTFQMLSETEQAKVNKVREFMKTAVAPIINDFWARDEFPFDLLQVSATFRFQGLVMRAMTAPAGATC
jgi:glutaryl-CoA dehydrogenase